MARLDKAVKHLLVFGALFCLCACEWDNDYYTKRGGWDYIRMPVRPPYELTSLDKGVEWKVGYKTEALSRFMTRVDELIVMDSIIILHCDSLSIVELSDPRETWSLLIPGSDIEVRTFRWPDLRDSLLKYTTLEGSIDSIQTGLMNCDSLWQHFRETGELPWTANSVDAP